MTIVNGISRIGFMSGGKRALWNDETMADTLTSRAVRFIESNRRNSFFLYFATHDIHVPRVPHDRFASSTEMGPRGNVIAELDWCVGRLIETLDRLNLTSNTLVLLTSDNGAVVDDGYQDHAVEKLGAHKPNGPLRGGKYSRFEGGTRVPFIVHWPARVKPGVSGALVSQVDLTASFSSLTGAQVPAGAAPDSANLLPALLGEKPSGREVLVEQAQTLSLRQGSWKLIPANKGAAVQQNTNTEMGGSPADQLFDLSADIGETRNVAPQHPDVVKEMLARLEKIRSAPPASR
jgi:arylsulfatase A-like enzyme